MSESLHFLFFLNFKIFDSTYNLSCIYLYFSQAHILSEECIFQKRIFFRSLHVLMVRIGLLLLEDTGLTLYMPVGVSAELLYFVFLYFCTFVFLYFYMSVLSESA